MDKDYTGLDILEVIAEAVNYNRFLADLILKHLSDGDKVVDYGAGIGTFAQIIHDKGYYVYCIELDPAQRETMESAGLQCAAALYHQHQQKFNFAYTLNVLEHIQDDVAALRDIYCALKPGGKLLVYVPSFTCLFSALDRKVGHVRRYRRSELEEKLKIAGFVVDESRYVDSVGFIATIVYKLIGDKEGMLSRRSVKFYDRYCFPVSLLLDKILSHLFGKNLLVVGRRN